VDKETISRKLARTRAKGGGGKIMQSSPQALDRSHVLLSVGGSKKDVRQENTPNYKEEGEK